MNTKVDIAASINDKTNVFLERITSLIFTEVFFPFFDENLFVFWMFNGNAKDTSGNGKTAFTEITDMIAVCRASFCLFSLDT